MDFWEGAAGVSSGCPAAEAPSSEPDFCILANAKIKGYWPLLIDCFVARSNKEVTKMKSGKKNATGDPN